MLYLIITQKGFSLPLIIIGAAVLIVVAAGVYYLGKSSNNTVTQQTIPISSPSAKIQTSETDETESWKTYEDKKMGITFKHPPTWDVKSLDSLSANELVIAPKKK